MNNAFRYVAEKLIEPASEDLWPLAVLWFDPATRGLKCSVASVGAELIVGHGRKVGLIIESTARDLCKQTKPSPGSAKGATKVSPAPPSPPRAASGVEGE